MWEKVGMFRVCCVAVFFLGASSSIQGQLSDPEKSLLAPHLDKIRRVVFTRHHELGPYPQHDLLAKKTNYAYTEAQSDGEWSGRSVQWHPGASLNLLEIDDQFDITVTALLEDPTGMMRDPDVSWDGKRILFAWKKSMDKDDYHLYEMDAETREIRQLTFGPGFVDFEGAYLPNGDIVFSSTRCVQVIDCYFATVSNLFLMDGDGKYMRRIGYDQVTTNYPQVTSDGTILYTRWEYNDRGQIYVQPLFQMYPDGTGQTEYYGNNSWFPTSILHARNIPGTGKAVAIIAGHHTNQRGKLAVIDPSLGRQENSGVSLLAPVRKLQDTIKVDSWGKGGDQWQYPYPLDEENFLVTFAPEGAAHWGIYFMNRDGERVLLASDPGISCSQPVPLMVREKTNIIPSRVDYTQETGTFTMEDIYIGTGLREIERGRVKKLRIVALDYQASGAFGENKNTGPAGNATVSTPVGIDDVSWDVKRILGETPVYEDGSAAFIVPARTPVYFQAIDDRGYVIQTMRSWSTLMPGETFSCVGCHEDKNEAVPTGKLTMAMQTGPQALEPFHDISGRGFSYPQIIQPILDAKCVSCHENANGIDLQSAPVRDDGARKSWNRPYLSLINNNTIEGDERKSAYVSWISPQSVPPVLWPYTAGAARSPLIAMLEQGHEGVRMTREEMEKIAAWIDLLVPHAGDYTEGMTDADRNAYLQKLQKRLDWEKQEAANIQEYIADHPETVWKPEKETSRPMIGFTIRTPGGRIAVSVPVSAADALKEVHVYNMNGIRVLQLKTRSMSFYWNGRSSDGNVVADGIYLVRVISDNTATSGKLYVSSLD